MDQSPLMLVVMDPTVNIQQLCRLCGSKTEIINRVNIFDSSDQSVNLPSMIQSCLSIDISAIDNLPKVICFTCVDKVENFTKFKTTCETTAHLLSSLCNQQVALDANFCTDSEQNIAQVPPPFVDTTTPSTQPDIVPSESQIFNSSYNVEKNSKNSGGTVPVVNTTTAAKVCLGSSKRTRRKAEIFKRNIALTDDKISFEINVDYSNDPTDKKIKEKIYNCDLCSKSFSSRKSIPRHMKDLHFPSSRVSCNICNKTLKNEHNLKIHIKMQHEKNYVFVCDFCGQGFMSKNHFETHVRMKHKNERPFQCLQCDKLFGNKYNLKLHVSNIHNDGSVQYICNICNKSFTSKYYLNSHIKNHEVSLDERKKVQCTICDVRCLSQYCLKEHMRTHTREKPFECQVCNNSYDRKKSLKLHMLTHTGERNHVCEICGSAFALPGNLKIHKLSVHEGIKMFKCNDCDKSYTQNKNLNIHLKKTGHTKLKSS